MTIRFATSAILGYLVFGLVGLTAPPVGGPSNLTAGAAVATLAFSFPETSADTARWETVSGRVSHGWLLRRAYVEGRLESPSSTRYSEQVLKVGWPFTVVRGFVRTVDSEVRSEGALLVGRLATTQPVRMLPLQPVWPGIVFLGLLGTVLAGVWSGLRVRLADERRRR